jgi:hypothetical protein
MEHKGKIKGIPSYSVIVSCEKQEIDPGEDVDFALRISGGGPIKFAKICIYSDGGPILTTFRWGDGAYMPETPATWLVISGPLLLDLFRYSNAESPEGKILGVETTVKIQKKEAPPMTVKVHIPKDIRLGDHEIRVVFTYQDIHGNWHTSDTNVKFHVRTRLERSWRVVLVGAVITVISGIITIIST